MFKNLLDFTRFCFLLLHCIILPILDFYTLEHLLEYQLNFLSGLGEVIVVEKSPKLRTKILEKNIFLTFAIP